MSKKCDRICLHPYHHSDDSETSRSKARCEFEPLQQRSEYHKHQFNELPVSKEGRNQEEAGSGDDNGENYEHNTVHSTDNEFITSTKTEQTDEHTFYQSKLGQLLNLNSQISSNLIMWSEYIFNISVLDFRKAQKTAQDEKLPAPNVIISILFSCDMQ